MESKSKYNNRIVHLDDLTFHSIFESEIYLELTKVIDRSAILRQLPILLKKPSTYSPKVSLVVDFAILDINESPLLYIEAKGHKTSSWLNKYCLLETIDPFLYKRYFVVFDDAAFLKLPKKLLMSPYTVSRALFCKWVKTFLKPLSFPNGTFESNVSSQDLIDTLQGVKSQWKQDNISTRYKA